MDLALVLPYAIGGSVVVGILAITQLFNRDTGRADERLEELRSGNRRDRAAGKQGMVGMLERSAPALSQALKPKTELEENELKIRLANAGFNHPLASEFYLAIKFMMLIVGALVGGAYGMLVYGPSQAGYTTIGLSAGAGFYLSEGVLWFLKRARQQAIFLQLPDVLDLLVVCVEAGLGLDAGMRRVAQELGDTAKEICSELDLSLLQLQMGRSRREVLHDFGTRTGVDDVKSLAAILIQAEKFGSSVAQALRVQSDAMRVKRRQMAEEKAQKTAVQMLFPMILFIFPGIFIVLVGPAAIKMVDQLLK